MINMNVSYTAMALIVDRSGSMSNIASDVIGSVKGFIGDQKKQEGRASLTVVQFDNQYEVVYDFKRIEEVDEEKFANEYSPRGSTALLDAIGRTVLAIDQRVESLPIEERPTRVVVAVITDGMENSSTDFTVNKIKEMIKDKEAKGWDFLFLGATLDAIDVANSYGFASSKAAMYEVSNVDKGIGLISKQATNARTGKIVEIELEERKELVN